MTSEVLLAWISCGRWICVTYNKLCWATHLHLEQAIPASPGCWASTESCALHPCTYLVGLGCRHQLTCLNSLCQSCFTTVPVLLLMEGREEKGRETSCTQILSPSACSSLCAVCHPPPPPSPITLPTWGDEWSQPTWVLLISLKDTSVLGCTGAVQDSWPVNLFHFSKRNWDRIWDRLKGNLTF